MKINVLGVLKLFPHKNALRDGAPCLGRLQLCVGCDTMRLQKHSKLLSHNLLLNHENLLAKIFHHQDFVLNL